MLEQFAHILTLDGLSSLLTLTALEIVLGVDNIVFIALIIQHLPEKKRELARRIGLSLALGLRVLLLLSIAWVLSLTKPIIGTFSGKDILLILGGLFLIYKSTTSVHDMFSDDTEKELKGKKYDMNMTILQIMLIDLVFSFDSVITAVGMTKNIPIIIVAMTIAMAIMLIFTGLISKFIFKYPSLKTLAISFILMIGVLLVGEGFGAHIERAFIYFAMGFSCLVETINILVYNKKNKAKSKS